MTREKAQDEILVRLDEIQQILRRYDPLHGDDYFSMTINRGEIRFNNDYWSGIQKPLGYIEGIDMESELAAEKRAYDLHH